MRPSAGNGARSYLTTGVLVIAAQRLGNRLQGLPTLARVVTHIHPGEPKKIAQYGYNRPTFTFYVGQPVAAIRADRLRTRKTFSSTNENGYLLTTEHNYLSMRDKLPADIVVLAEEPRFPNQGNVVLLGRSNHSHESPTKVTQKAKTILPLKDEY